MTTVSTIAGIALILIGFRDMFQSLLHPRGRGAISHAVAAITWALSRRSGHRFGSAVGPAAMAVAVLVWVTLQGVGWALIYLPHIPGGFSYSSGIDPTRYNAFAEALYVSFVSLSTLGFGDAVPTDPWVRFVSPLQALTGFTLLTAALTWFTQVHPAVARREALALNLNALAETRFAAAVPTLEPRTTAATLQALAQQVNGVCVDLTQTSESYYFQEQDAHLSLSRHLPYAVTLLESSRASAATEVRAASALLSHALDQLRRELQQFVGTEGDLGAVLQAYAADQERHPRFSARPQPAE